MRRPLDKKPPKPLGSIRADELMPWAEFGRRMNLAARALAAARRRGLRTILFGRNRYVLGRDALEWFDRLGDQQGDA